MSRRRQAGTIRRRLVADPNRETANRDAADRPHLVVLPSTEPSLRFEVKLLVECQWPSTGTAPPSALEIAAEGITQRAEDLCRHHALTECQRLHGKLAIALMRWEQVGNTGISARAQCAAVTADPGLISAVAAREEAARRQIVLSWQHEQREHTAARLRSLIIDPLRATAWWFADNQEEVGKLSEVAKEFQELQNLLSPTVADDTAGGLVDEFLIGVDLAEQQRLLMNLRRVFVHRSRPDLVERIDSVIREDAVKSGAN